MSSQSPPSIHYEVYTQDGGTRWNLHARYERNQREAALADAKQVEKTLQIPAKVIRETYYPATNQSEESVIYGGDGGLKAKVAARANAMPSYRGRGGGGAASAGAAPGAARGASGASSKNTASEISTPVRSTAKVALVVAASLTVAAIATKLAGAMLDPVSADVADATQSLILFATFLITFAAVAIPLSSTMLNFKMFGGGSRGKRKPARMPPMPQAKPAGAAPAAEAAAALEGEPDWGELKDDEETIPDLEDEIEEPVDPLDEIEEIPAVAEAKAEEETEDDKQEPPARQAGAIFVKFVNALTTAVRRKRPTLDAYNMFGVDLVMAGAIDVLGQQTNLPPEERRALLKSSIEAMGVKSATAQAFANKYEEYLGEPRYLPMILAGRSTMDAFMHGQDLLGDTIGPVFEQWNKPQGQAAASSSRIMTVMFTDMVGSTDLTQAQGDKAAQNIVRRHNTIVRNALAEFQGKEIKHTGDGIMASFTSSASGVEAAVVIQRAIAKHNAQHPDQVLHIRVGINAGEPIEEEEDLFGSTVQLAARVCARCDTDQILCTNVVKELASGRGLKFSSIGGQDLKGFKEQVVLYRVDWRE